MCSRHAYRACSWQHGLLRGAGRRARGSARWGRGSRRPRLMDLAQLRRLHAADHCARCCSLDRVVGEDSYESVNERCSVKSSLRRRVEPCCGIPTAAGQTSRRRRVAAALALVGVATAAGMPAEVAAPPLLLPHGTCSSGAGLMSAPPCRQHGGVRCACCRTQRHALTLRTAVLLHDVGSASTGGGCHRSQPAGSSYREAIYIGAASPF